MTCHHVVFHSDAPRHAPPLSWHPLSLLPGGIGDRQPCSFSRDAAPCASSLDAALPLLLRPKCRHHGARQDSRVPLTWTPLPHCCSHPSADTMKLVCQGL